jgi:hypothetical protein
VNIIGRKYRINPETLRLEVAKLPLKKRLFVGVVAGVVVLSATFGMRVVFDQNAKSPRLAYYEKKNELLRHEYNMLNQELKKDELVLSDLQRKDDRLYRSIFGMEPLPTSIREAGTGGAVMHPVPKTISDPEVVIDVSENIDKLFNKAMIQSNSFEDLEDAAFNNQLLLARKPLIKPISPADRVWLTSTFGSRTDPFTKRHTSHHGIDLAGRLGIEIHATGDGVVKVAKANRTGYGNEVIVDHDFGYSSIYGHLQDILVKTGDEVKRGQVIGTLGSTGRSTGPHLHYEVRQNNKAINPMYFYFDELTSEEYKLITDRVLAE